MKIVCEGSIPAISTTLPEGVTTLISILCGCTFHRLVHYLNASEIRSPVVIYLPDEAAAIHWASS